MNCKKLSFAIVQVLSIALVSLSAQTENQPFFKKEIESGMQAVLMENKEYADAKAKSDSIRKQIESLQEKLASNDPELKKLLEERKKLLDTALSTEAVRNNRAILSRMPEIEKKLNHAFSSSKEYAVLSLRFASTLAEIGFLMQKILFSSSDKRILNFNEAVGKYTDASFSNAAKNAPKAKVEGSDEYKAAMYGVEKYKEDPVRNKWAMVHGYALLMQKMRQIAVKEPSIRELSRKLSLKWAEVHWKNCLLQEKNPELAWKAKTAQFSMNYKDMESVKKYNALNNELWNVLRADTEYVKLEKEAQELQQAYIKALDDFAAKSNAPEAVEYRKVKALMDELNKTASSGKTK